LAQSKDIARILRSSNNQDVLLIDLSNVTFIDSSASITLEEVIIDVQNKNDIVIRCGLRQRVKTVLDKFGISSLLAEGCIVDSRLQALQKADELIRSQATDPA